MHVQFLENFVENGHRMLQMIDNLLSMDRFESTGVKLDRTFFDVHEMGQEVLQNFEHPAFEKGVTLVNSVPFGTLAFAHRYLYFVVLNNLISNGLKFSDHGGTIEVLPGSEGGTRFIIRFPFEQGVQSGLAGEGR